MERVLLLLPTSTYRTRDFMAAASRLEVEVVVASEERSTMEALGEGSLLTLDFLHPEAAADRVSSFHEQHPLSAVIAVDEETAVVAAEIAKRLALEHNPPQAALRARLKHRMREALAAAGVPQPAFAVARTSDDPEELAAGTRYPAVLKPVFLSGSRGVVRVDDRADFGRRFAWLREFLGSPEMQERGGAEADLVLIEDYLPGPEVAVEGILTKGRLDPLAVFDKPDPLEGPFFEETIYLTPSRLPRASQREILEITARACRAMGLTHGPIHAELRPPAVLEIAGRSIGGLCSRTLRFGLGISLEELILSHALGRSLGAPERQKEASGVMMIPIPGAGRLEEVGGVDEARSVPGIEELVITATVGRRLVPLPEGSSYLGFLFARAGDPAAVEGALRAAHARLRFRIEPE